MPPLVRFVTDLHQRNACKYHICLQCNQEETDGRLLLHAAHAAKAGY